MASIHSSLNHINCIRGVYVIRCIHKDFVDGVKIRVYVITLRKHKGITFTETATHVLNETIRFLQEIGTVSEFGQTLIVRSNDFHFTFYIEGYKHAMYRAWLENGVLHTELLHRSGLEQAIQEAGKRSKIEPRPWWNTNARIIMKEAITEADNPALIELRPDVLERTIYCISGKKHYQKYIHQNPGK